MHLISFKRFFWYNEERAAVEVKMKKMRAFYPCAEIAPGPAPAASFIFDPEFIIG